MMKSLKVDLEKADSFINGEDIASYQDKILQAHKMLHGKTGPGSEYLGWLDLPVEYDKDEFLRIGEAAAKIRSNSDALVVIGIGGSYLGARAAVEALNHTFLNSLGNAGRKAAQVFFAGHNISSSYLSDLFDLLENKEISINVVSKSGTTTEPAIAFRFFKEYMEKRYGKKKAGERIFVTTDKTRGALRNLACSEGYESFVIPDDVGGRYSVLTAAGLLPIAATEADIGEIMRGAADARELYREPLLEKNDCYMYAAARNYFYDSGKIIEIMECYEPSMHFFIEWWKQLFGESEGKDGKGIFPAGADFTTDLHSMGQYIQDGKRNIFETVLNIEKAKTDLSIKENRNDADQLNYLAEKTMHHINSKALEGTLLAHADGNVPGILLNVPQIDSYYFGQLAYFFEKACAISGYVLGVNPFNQPGVEAYKKNMFALLDKPGYEDVKRSLGKKQKRKTIIKPR